MKKMKMIAPLIALGAVMALTSCGGSSKPYNLLCLHDVQSTYDKNFIDAFNSAADATSTKNDTDIKTGLDEEENTIYNEAKTRASFGAKLIVTDSYGHQKGLIKAAKEYPNTQFVSCTGDTAVVSNQSNFHNAFAKIHQGRFLSGIVAGYNIKERVKGTSKFSKITDTSTIKIGYVGAFPYAEVKSGYSAFYLGVKYALNGETYKDNVKMVVKNTGSWYDVDKESTAAKYLIDNEKCVLISQHADSIGAPKACEDNNIPNVGYNIANTTDCPKTYLVSSKINWVPYYKDIIGKVKDGKGSEIPVDYAGDLTSGSVELCEYNTNEGIISDECKKAVEDATKLLKDKKLRVFDVSTFQVRMDKQTQLITLDKSYKAHTWNSDYTQSLKEANVVVEDTTNGITYFDESNPNLLRSSPYFAADFTVDGIEVL